MQTPAQPPTVLQGIRQPCSGSRERYCRKYRKVTRAKRATSCRLSKFPNSLSPSCLIVFATAKMSRECPNLQYLPLLARRITSKMTYITHLQLHPLLLLLLLLPLVILLLSVAAAMWSEAEQKETRSRLASRHMQFQMRNKKDQVKQTNTPEP